MFESIWLICELAIFVIYISLFPAMVANQLGIIIKSAFTKLLASLRHRFSLYPDGVDSGWWMDEMGSSNMMPMNWETITQCLNMHNVYVSLPKLPSVEDVASQFPAMPEMNDFIADIELTLNSQIEQIQSMINSMCDLTIQLTNAKQHDDECNEDYYVQRIMAIEEELRKTSVDLKRKKEELLEQEYKFKQWCEEQLVLPQLISRDGERASSSIKFRTQSSSGYLSNAITDQMECGLCFDYFVEPITLRCGHSACRYCLKKLVHVAEDNQRTASCPWCKTAIGTDDLNANVSIALSNQARFMRMKEMSSKVDASTSTIFSAQSSFDQQWSIEELIDKSTSKDPM